MIRLILLLSFIGISMLLFAHAISPGIRVVYEENKKAVNIQWQQKSSGTKTFIVQRSDNNADWEDIALQTVPNFTAGKTFQYYDYKPAAGENYYRLKSIAQNNEVEYSASVMVITGAAGSNWVMYPVPVKDMLTLQYKGLKKIAGVVNIFIRNITGRIITRVRSASLNTTIQIPVNNLGSGIYDVQIIIEDEVVWNQRFVK